jgi:hypothetical protein
MKDIDFLPEWYKTGRRREVSYRTQYMALGGIFLVMAVWSLAASRSISRARAEFGDMAEMHAHAESVSAELSVLEDQFTSLRKKFESMEETDSRINVADVLAEMSFLIGQEIVLRKVEFTAEKFPTEQKDKASTGTGAVVRAVRAGSRQKRQLLLGNVRFKVMMAGVAANAGDVAALTLKLEESPYFFQVVPSLSNTKLQIENAPASEATPDVVGRVSEARRAAADTGISLQATEFEINCYLANYRES